MTVMQQSNLADESQMPDWADKIRRDKIRRDRGMSVLHKYVLI